MVTHVHELTVWMFMLYYMITPSQWIYLCMHPMLLSLFMHALCVFLMSPILSLWHYNFFLLASDVCPILFQYYLPSVWHHRPHGQVSHVLDYYWLIPNLSSLWLIWSDEVLISLFEGFGYCSWLYLHVFHFFTDKVWSAIRHNMPGISFLVPLDVSYMITFLPPITI